MWDCPACGCRAIAASLTRCPVVECGKERDMPKVTSGGPSNAWEPGDAPAADAAVEGAAAEAEAVAAVAGVFADDGETEQAREAHVEAENEPAPVPPGTPVKAPKRAPAADNPEA